MPEKVTIDSLHRDALSLKEDLKGKKQLRPAELREIWRERLRPFWRLEPSLYEGMASRLAANGENFLVIEVAAESRSFFGELPNMVFLEALALARSGSPQACQEALLGRPDILAKVADAPSLLARTFKDAWKATGDERFLEESFRFYRKAYHDTGGDYFPGVNSAAVAMLLGRKKEGSALASEVRAKLGEESANDDYWTAVTRAECSLIIGEIEDAQKQYNSACNRSDVPRANLVTTRAQARLLLACRGQAANAFDCVFALPNVACFTGHRIDQPGRPQPRFPSSATHGVAERIAAILREQNIRIGFSSAAQGGDLIFCKEMLQTASGETHVFLPGNREAFRRASVTMEGDRSWDTIFDEVLGRIDEVTMLESAETEGLQERDFAYCNVVCLGSAMAKARELDCTLKLIAVWDGLPGPAGGTSDMVGLARSAGLEVEVINPLGLENRSAITVQSTTQDRDQQLFAIAVFENLGAAQPKGLKAARWLLWNTPMTSAVFPDASSAIDLALEVASSSQGKASLHYAPLTFVEHPLTREMVPSGKHLLRAQELLSACSQGNVYTSAEFAAAARLEGSPNELEYIGRVILAEGAPEKPVFRLSAGKMSMPRLRP